MKSLTLFLFLILPLTGLGAQQVIRSSFAVVGGTNITFPSTKENFSSNDVRPEGLFNGDAAPGLGSSVGAISGLRLGEQTWLSTGFRVLRSSLYTGASRAITVNGRFGVDTWAVARVTQFEAPVTVRREFSQRRFRFFVEAGLHLTFIAQNDYRIVRQGGVEDREKLDLIGPRRLGLSAVASGGVIYAISPRYELFAQLIYREGIYTNRLGPFADDRAKMRGFGLEVGARRLIIKAPYYPR